MTSLLVSTTPPISTFLHNHVSGLTYHYSLAFVSRAPTLAALQHLTHESRSLSNSASFYASVIAYYIPPHAQELALRSFSQLPVKQIASLSQHHLHQTIGKRRQLSLSGKIWHPPLPMSSMQLPWPTMRPSHSFNGTLQEALMINPGSSSPEPKGHSRSGPRDFWSPRVYWSSSYWVPLALP